MKTAEKGKIMLTTMLRPFSDIEKFPTFNVQRYPIWSARFVTSSEAGDHVKVYNTFVWSIKHAKCEFF